MLVKDVSSLIGCSVNVMIYTRVKYSKETVISFHTNHMTAREFTQIVEKTDALASKRVTCLSVTNGNFCICISDVSRGDIVE